MTYAHWAAAVLHNGLGRYDEALAAARQASRGHRRARTSPCGRCPSWSRRPRAAGDAELARRRARAAGRDDPAPAAPTSALGIEARSRALLSDGEAAEDLLPRGDRPAGPHPAAPGARPRAPALRRMAAPREPPRRRARAAAHRPRHVRRDGHGGVRRARPARAAGHRRDGAQAHRRDAPTQLTAQEAQIARLARDGLYQPGDRRPAVPQPRARSNGTCARCSPSSASAPAASCAPRWRGSGRTTRRPSRRPQRPTVWRFGSPSMCKISPVM